MVEKIPIYFFKEDVRFRLNYSKELKKWIEATIRKKRFQVKTINFIFCSDKYLLQLNRQFLHHNYFTDIITFDNSIGKNKIEADIYISVDRVKVNAKRFKVAFDNELHRVLIHGILHITGFDDKSEQKSDEMKKAEDYWLSKRGFLQK
jgi:rRNA maturation RNase YbeY